MNIHKEGQKMLGGFVIISLLLNGLVFAFLPEVIILKILLLAITLFGLIMLLIFFRNPERVINKKDDNIVYAPADGKVVVIEEVFEPEYFKDKRLQVSIFMSPLNVHVNRNPIGGEVKFSKYHKGKYLVAWHPKSSTENERTTVVISNGKTEIMFRQIAGALARRIINYLEVGNIVTQGADMGFIKFGSRVDVFLPLGTKINVKIDDVVKGNTTIIGNLS